MADNEVTDEEVEKFKDFYGEDMTLEEIRRAKTGLYGELSQMSVYKLAESLHVCYEPEMKALVLMYLSTRQESFRKEVKHYLDNPHLLNNDVA